MDLKQREALIARYVEGPDVVAGALAGIADDQLDITQESGGWTVRQVVHHLADSEMTSAIRLRRLLAEEHPLIAGYDEEAFARTLYYTDRPITAALAALQAARQTTAEILTRLTDAEWAREGTHSESGRYTVADWLEIYAAHAHDHADQIRRARAVAAVASG